MGLLCWALYCWEVQKRTRSTSLPDITRGSPPPMRRQSTRRYGFHTPSERRTVFFRDFVQEHEPSTSEDSTPESSPSFRTFQVEAEVHPEPPRTPRKLPEIKSILRNKDCPDAIIESPIRKEKIRVQPVTYDKAIQAGLLKVQPAVKLTDNLYYISDKPIRNHLIKTKVLHTQNNVVEDPEADVIYTCLEPVQAFRGSAWSVALDSPPSSDTDSWSDEDYEIHV